VRLLLDTHVFLWWSEDSRRLKAPIRRAIEEADDVFVSAASIWEASIKAALGKLELRASLADTVVRAGFSPLSVDFAHAEAVCSLPRLHADPFDRMLVAQAQVEALHLVSHDPALAKYPVSFLPA
jgi:PIN domain nuclease of toxin-antitoxin system